MGDINEDTPFPSDELSRKSNVLETMCAQRWEDAGKRLEGVDVGAMGGPSDLKFWQISNSNELEFVPKKKKVPLPSGPPGQPAWEFELEDACDFKTMLKCKQNAGFSLHASAYADVKDTMSEAWTY